MTKNREKRGFLTKSMTDFLRMDEEARRKKYGYDVNKYYERIIDNIEESFHQMQFAFSNLPHKQRDKIDLITSYDSLINYIKKHKLAENLPHITLKNAETAIKSIMDEKLQEDKILKEIAWPDFERVLNWLNYWETRKYTSTWNPKKNNVKTGMNSLMS